MKSWSLAVVGILCARIASADLVPAASQAVAPERPGMFAAASAPFAKRLTPEQRDEWRFLKDAAAAARFEHDAARMALSKSGDANVRSLAATLMNQQASAQSALQQMLRVRNMAPPMLANDQRKALNRLTKLQGTKFDHEWVEWVALRSQQDNLQAFEKAAASVRDLSLRSWIERTLPAMRYQMAAAERIVTGGTKYARLAPTLPRAAIKSQTPATALMGAAPAANPADLGEGNMVLGPARTVAVKLSEPSTR